MAVLSVFINVVAPIIAIVGLSIVFARRFNPDVRALCSVAVYLFTPFLVLDGMANSDITLDEFTRIGIVVTVVTLVMGALGLGITRFLRFDRKLEGAFLLSILLMNAANYGFPLNEFAFGVSGLQRAMIFYVMSAVIANTIGVFLASRGSASIRQSLLNMFRVPLLYGMIIGLVINFAGYSLPLPVQRLVSLLGQASVPTMMVVLGIQLTGANLKGRLGPIMLATGLKLVVAPLVVIALTVFLEMPELTEQVSIIEAGMPTAIFAGVLATEFGSDAEFTTAVTLVSTLASVLTLSILLTVVG